MTDKLQQMLHREVVETRGDGPEYARPSDQRRLFLNEFANRRPRQRLWYVMAAAGGAIAVVIGLLLQPFDESLKPLSQIGFHIGTASAPGAEGDWVEAPEELPVSIRFDDGSEFVLFAGASGRVAHADEDNVVLDLASGRVDCDINGNGTTNWTVRAGTYRVRVTGTAFRVIWKPDGKSLEVRVTDGSVRVTGAALNKHGVELQKGDHLQVDGNLATISRTEVRVPGDAADGPIPRSDKLSNDEAPVHPPTAEAPGPAKDVSPANSAAGHWAQPGKEEENWRVRFDNKDYAGAMDLATVEGLDKLIGTSSPRDLEKLSKAARYARRSDAAKQILTGMENRFAGTYRAHNATYLLGRVALELDNNPSAAQQHFEKYLAEAPGGTLADESIGRLMEIHRRAGNTTAAKQYAKNYLKLYPNGSFATLARSVLE